MSDPEFQYFIIETIDTHIPQGTRGECTLQVKRLDGEDVDLSVYDALELKMLNWPDQDEEITKDCTIDPDDSSKCYFSFDETESEAWLAAPYYCQLTATRYLRDQEVVTSASGYIPTEQTLSYEQCTTAFTVGATVTGDASGATGIIKENTHYGTLGILTLVDISGAFVDGEDINGDEGGTAVADGILSSPDDIDSVFADDGEDFASLGVQEDDELVIGSNTYVIAGFYDLIDEWLSLDEDPEETGTSISYTINTYDPALSTPDHIYKSELFSLYIEEAL